jgi:hypothetical protein
MVARRGRISVWVFFVVFLAATVLVCVSSVRQFSARGRNFERWPKTQATVLRYERHLGSAHGDRGSLLRFYSYQLDGREVIGRGPNVVQSFGLHDLQEGATVEIAHDPDKPEDVLSRSDVQHIPSRFGVMVQVLALGFLTVATFVGALRGER